MKGVVNGNRRNGHARRVYRDARGMGAGRAGVGPHDAPALEVARSAEAPGDVRSRIEALREQAIMERALLPTPARCLILDVALAIGTFTLRDIEGLTHGDLLYITKKLSQRGTRR